MSINLNAQENRGLPATNVVKHQRVSGYQGNSNNSINSVASPSETITPTGSSSEVGITEGALSVSLTGAANYSIPIVVPKGITGVEPKISLNYSSQGDNGMAGYGWDIGGISSITRIPSTKFHDGEIDPVDGDNLDRFALDGQRLILKNPTGTTYLFNGAVFETEIFSNIKITYINTDPTTSYFYVEYPDGSTANYGDLGDSQNTTTFAITQWKNSVGIPINYSYIKENNFIRISGISYGSPLNTTQKNLVSFEYITRLRPEESYVNGMLFINNKILSKIKSTSNLIDFRQYDLAYDETNLNGANNLNYQRLRGITESVIDNGVKISYNPTIFSDYTTPETIYYGNITASLSVGNIDITNASTVSGDFNGDGKMDFILYPTTKTKYWVFNDNTNASSQLLDYEQIGLFETIFSTKMLNFEVNGNYKFSQQDGWCVVKKNGIQTIFDTYFWDPVSVYPQYSKTHNFPTYNGAEIPKEYLSGDFNGDSLTDVIIVNKNNGGSTSSQAGITYFLDLDRRISTNYINGSGTVTVANGSKYYVSDANGDGKSDLLVFSEGIVSVYSLNNANQLALLWQQSNILITVASNKIILLGDYNGDGKSDFMIPAGNGSSTWYKFTSKGNAFAVQSLTGFTYQINTSISTRHYISTDYNHDGKSDIIRLIFNSSGSASITCFPNKNGSFLGTLGDSYSTTIPVTTGIDHLNLPFVYSSDRPNESLEIGFIRNNKIYTFESLKDFNTDKLLTEIETGNGVKEVISYKPLKPDPYGTTPDPNNPTIYTSIGSQNVQYYPYADIYSSPSLNVVAKLERLGNNYKKQFFTYYGGVYAMNGMGFLGFQETMRTNWFDTAQPNQYMISNVSKFDMSLRGANTLNFSTQFYWVNFGQVPSSFISKNINTYNMVNGVFENPLLSNKVFKLKKTKVQDYDGLKNINSETNMVYNAYNSPISSTTIIKNGTTTQQTSSTTIVYDNALVTPYVIDRPLNEQQTVTAYSDTRNTETQYTYTSLNQVETVKNKSMNSDFITTSYEYDTYGNVKKETINAPDLAVPRVTNYLFDSVYNGRFLTKVTDIEGLETNYTYNNAKGTLLTEVNPYGLTTTNTYDAWGKKITEKDYLNNILTINYSKTANNTTTITKTMPIAHGGASFEVFDLLGRKIITGDKNIQGTYSYTKVDYDNLDRVVKKYEPYFYTGDIYSYTPLYFTQSTYDGYSRVSGITYNTGKTETIAYSGLTTTVTTVADGVTKSKSSTTDAIGNMISSTESPQGGTIDYTYYANSVMKTTSYSGNTISTLQDNWGRKSRLVDPSAGTYNYTYNNLGEILTEETPKGVTTYNYDDFGKVLTKTVVGKATTTPPTSTNTLTTNVYNPTTKLLDSTSFNDIESNSITNYVYTYNTYKQLSKIKESNSMTEFETEIIYDTFGRPLNQRQKAATYIAGTTNINKQSDKWTTNVYQNGVLYKITDGQTTNGSGAMLWQTNETNARGQLTKAQYGNGIFVTNNYNNSNGQLTSQNHTALATGLGAIYYKATYDWSLFPQRNMFNSRQFYFPTNTVENFTYDEQDRLTSYPNESGVIETQTYAENGRIASNSNGVYNYATISRPYRNTSIDVNTTSKNYYQNSALQQISYSALKKPISIYQESTIGVAKERIDFLYNVGESRSVMFYGDTNTNKLARKYRRYYAVGGSMEITEERDASGNIIATNFITYIGGDAYSAPVISRSDGTNQSFIYLHRDNLGSILNITSQTKTLLERRSFDAWGNLTRLINSSNQDVILNGQVLLPSYRMILDRGYTGHEHLFGVGLINMNGRLYDPKLHRFIMPDNFIQNPTNSQNYNRYGYVLNNPLMYIDPSGESWKSFWKSVGNGLSDIFKAGVSFTVAIATTAIGITIAAASIAIGSVVGTVQFVGSGFQNSSIISNQFKIVGGLFQGNIGQIASRFTKELPQTMLGLGISLGSNAIGRVKSVSYYGGATVVEHYQSGWGAFTLGSYINGEEGIHADSGNDLFKHEYGHYLQSQKVGWKYINDYAIPSLFDARYAKRHNDSNIHDAYWTEQDANILAINYFGQENWDYLHHPIFGSGFNDAFDLTYSGYR
jgi:RHS repeat-associated protein